CKVKLYIDREIPPERQKKGKEKIAILDTDCFSSPSGVVLAGLFLVDRSEYPDSFFFDTSIPSSFENLVAYEWFSKIARRERPEYLRFHTFLSSRTIKSQYEDQLHVTLPEEYTVVPIVLDNLDMNDKELEQACKGLFQMSEKSEEILDVDIEEE
ncbi:MAG: hypothetical protein PHE21_03700, partial [Candidatus Dojkabacteria bacterium]|nr:hypothetical protein [Candidatus Dojkabacteria bacterium]